MSGALDLDLCIPHKRSGRLVRAWRTVNGEGMCKECFRGEEINTSTGVSAALAAQVQIEEKSKMRKTIDWDQVQRDRDAGVPVSTLVKKYGVSNPSIYTRTKAPKAGLAAPVRTNERTNERISRSKAPQTGGDFDGVLEDLRSRREKLDEAIRAIENLA